jgi:FKBP-type peptidyl-prolyl cis-trans isomerase FkpA
MKMSRSTSIALAVSLVVVAACSASQAPPAASPSTMTEDEKVLYAAGLMLGRNLASFNLSPAELETVEKGLADAAAGRPPQVDLQVYGPKVQQLSRARAAAKAEVEKTKSQPFLDAAAKEPGAVTTPTGLVFRSLKPGTGPSPAATDTVKVHYTGTLMDGKVFDSSVQRGQPAEFPLNGVIPCWTEGLQKMKVGEKAKLVCPSSIAYGDMGHPPSIPGGATLVFEVELLETKPRPIPSPRPPAPGASPAAPLAPGASPRPPAPAPRPSPSPAASPAASPQPPR